VVQEKLSRKKMEKYADQKSLDFFAENRLDPDAVIALLESAAKVDKRQRRMLGQYNVSVDTIRDKLTKHLKFVLDWCDRNNLTPVHAHNGYLYLTGGSPEIFQPGAPLLRIDELPSIYITPNPAMPKEQKVFYPKHQYYEGFKVTDRATNTLTVHEMRTYQTIIDSLLANKRDAALQAAQDSLRQIIDGKVAVQDLVWHAKKSGRFKAYEQGSITHFVTSPPAGVTLNQANGRQYFETALRKNGKPGKVYVMLIEEVRPDAELYAKRLAEQLACLLAPADEKEITQLALIFSKTS
jgi:hypothetical protein